MFCFVYGSGGASGNELKVATTKGSSLTRLSQTQAVLAILTAGRAGFSGANLYQHPGIIVESKLVVATPFAWELLAWSKDSLKSLGCRPERGGGRFGWARTVFQHLSLSKLALLVPHKLGKAGRASERASEKPV